MRRSSCLVYTSRFLFSHAFLLSLSVLSYCPNTPPSCLLFPTSAWLSHPHTRPRFPHLKNGHLLRKGGSLLLGSRAPFSYSVFTLLQCGLALFRYRTAYTPSAAYLERS
ncbi:hypothetical protein F4778DRAFT_593420 [Xylariomycetidae sp. FL2044]|nr:hypothetical protein F4778DRAFT_593420 [Xylariomycetidae sp. FL2044]